MKVLIIISIFLLTSCASITPIETLYSTYNIQLSKSINTDEPIAILVKDSRPYVLTEDKGRGFIGLARFYGAPISINLKDDITVAQDVAGRTKIIMAYAAPNTKAFGIVDETSFESIIDEQNLYTTTLLFDLNEWKVDAAGFGNESFYYDISLEVRSKDGTALANVNQNGKDVYKDANELNLRYAQILYSLLKMPEVIHAINTGTKLGSINLSENNNNSQPLETSEPVKEVNQNSVECSVSQILTMKESGLSESQINAACEKK